jgi:hypothetical protein
MYKMRFLLTFTFLVSIGFFGTWLGFQTRDPSDVRMLLGPLLVLAAMVGLLIAFRRDLHKPEGEKRAEWERTKAKGKRNYVLGQIGFFLLSWVPLSLFSLVDDVYWGGESRGVTLQHLRSRAAVGVLVAAICGPRALMRWSYQERKYSGRWASRSRSITIACNGAREANFSSFYQCRSRAR